MTEQVLPNVKIMSTDGRLIDLQNLPGYCVLFFYPMTGQPGKNMPDGWSDLPRAKGCTPQCCAYQDLYQEFLNFNVQVFGVSSQDTEYQQELVSRLSLPYPILSDCNLVLQQTFNLRTMTTNDITVYERQTVIIKNSCIIARNYPIEISTEDPIWALNFLKNQQLSSS